MKNTGIIRKVDELGRIVLPIELRRSLGIEERDPVEISLENDCVILRKQESRCIFCSAENNLTAYRGKYICTDCLNQINEENED